jgi:PKHD-type hydroxylase
MLSKFSYWMYEAELSKKTCNKIINHFKKIKPSDAEVGFDSSINRKVRNSDVVFSADSELYEIITPLVENANKAAGWNVDIDWHESMQFTIYNKKQHYDWHTDNLEEPYNEKSHINYQGKIRKLSTCVSLTDPKKYEGGDFYFNFGKETIPTKIPEFKKQGSVVVFPSFIWHKVTPITKGTRYSLVNWSLGAPWR